MRTRLARVAGTLRKAVTEVVISRKRWADPGPGAQTFFYTNQQSARLMFYHDHAWGITRLNVYAGKAAGYLISDAAEKALDKMKRIGVNGVIAAKQ